MAALVRIASIVYIFEKIAYAATPPVILYQKNLRALEQEYEAFWVDINFLVPPKYYSIKKCKAYRLKYPSYKPLSGKTTNFEIKPTKLPTRKVANFQPATGLG